MTVFHAHAPIHRPQAQALAQALGALAALPTADPRPGEASNPALDKAQRSAAVTAILLGRAGNDDPNLRAQAALGVELARAEPQAHRVVTVYVDGPPAHTPPGLTPFERIDLAAEGLPAVVRTLQARVRDPQPAPRLFLSFSPDWGLRRGCRPLPVPCKSRCRPRSLSTWTPADIVQPTHPLFS